MLDKSPGSNPIGQADAVHARAGLYGGLTPVEKSGLSQGTLRNKLFRLDNDYS